MAEVNLYPFARVRHVFEAANLAGSEETQIFCTSIAVGYTDDEDETAAYGQLCVWRMPRADNPTESDIVVTLKFLGSSTDDEFAPIEVDGEGTAICYVWPGGDIETKWTLDDIVTRWRFQPDAPIWFWARERPPQLFEIP